MATSLWGTIPTELGSLTSLTSLDLSGNSLWGTIPTELGSLTGLTSLDLSGNSLSGPIPTELGSLTSLTSLDLSGSLTYLDLSGNNLTGSIPTELGSLTNLTSLDLNVNNLGGTIPTELGSLTNLTSLDLNYNFLDGTIPAELGSLTNLTYLDLNYNYLDGMIPGELGSLTNLTHLDLNYNFLEGAIPAELGSLTSLTYLDLRNNYLTGEIPEAFSNLSNLTSLYLSGNSLTGCISETLPYTTDNDLNSLSLPVCVTTAVDVSDPLLGQSVTLTATANGPAGSVLTYQWQEYTGGAWTNLSSTSTTLSVSSNTETAKIFKVVVSSDGTVWKESAPVIVRWRPISLTVTAFPEYPETQDATRETVTLSATSDAPAEVTYQWQQWLDGVWANLGLASTSATKTVSFSSLGTRKFRAVALQSAASPVESLPIHVTWDEWDVLTDLLRSLQTAAQGDSILSTTEITLLECMNQGVETDDQFESFDDVLINYVGTTKAKMDKEGVCYAQAESMFAAVESRYPLLLDGLKSTEQHSAFLATPRGRDIENNIGDPISLKLYARLLSGDPFLTSGENQTNAQRDPSEVIGFQCIPFSGEAPDLPGKMRVLNCLILDTPHSFWVDQSNTDELVYRIDNEYVRDDGRTVGPLDWLSYGDGNVCSHWFDGPSPTCIRHDFLWGSLKEFDDSNVEYGLDASWNPRNKHLADILFKASIAKYGCQNPSNLAKATWCFIFENSLQAWLMGFGVVSTPWGNNNWPITERDILHVSNNPEFEVCDGPMISNISAQSDTNGITLNWVYEPGCAIVAGNFSFIISLRTIWSEGVVVTLKTDEVNHNGCDDPCSHYFAYDRFFPGDKIYGVVIDIEPLDREHAAIYYRGEYTPIGPFSIPHLLN